MSRRTRWGRGGRGRWDDAAMPADTARDEASTVGASVETGRRRRRRVGKMQDEMRRRCGVLWSWTG